MGNERKLLRTESQVAFYPLAQGRKQWLVSEIPKQLQIKKTTSKGGCGIRRELCLEVDIFAIYTN